jgi:hypothetical protein
VAGKAINFPEKQFVKKHRFNLERKQDESVRLSTENRNFEETHILWGIQS